MLPPILADKHPEAPSVFKPDALLREARRQRGLAVGDVPPICLLDPDGDLARRLRRDGRSRPCPVWACYHTELDRFYLGGRDAPAARWGSSAGPWGRPSPCWWPSSSSPAAAGSSSA